MSKAHHRQPHSPAPVRSVSEPLWNRIPHKAVIFSLVLAAVPFAMGKYFEFNSPGAFDSGAYLYSAHRVLGGAVPGPGEAVTAKAGTLLVNMLGISLFGYSDNAAKIVQMFLQIAALATMFFVMRRIFGVLAAGVALFIAVFYLSAPVIAKFGNVKEQYAIACMMLGVSMLLMRQMGGTWWWGLLAGGFLAWGPMFKETGLSALMAAFIFLVLQPFLKNRSWRLTGTDFGLVVMGGVLAIAPVQLWISHIGAPTAFNPYVMSSRYAYSKAMSYLHTTPPAPVRQQDANKPAAAPQKQKSSDYLEGARAMVPLNEQAGRVFRWYLVVILPIALALGAMILRFVRLLDRTAMAHPAAGEQFVFLLVLWWLIDMAFVWVSPRPWEEYFLPLCASGALSGTYIAAMYRDKLRSASEKGLWIGAGAACLVCMIVMAWPIAFGLRTSPFSGGKYGSPSHGYVQKFGEVKEGAAAWETLAHYIRDNSGPKDMIYVWGWFPGIYVESQRDSASTSMAFTSEMHVVSPRVLTTQVKDLLKSFEQTRPRFIVDTRKNDFPFVYPPLEFWPFVGQGGFLPNDPAIVPSFEAQWGQYLRENITAHWAKTKTPEAARELADEEALRFDAMKPIRDYVMTNYDVVMKERYGNHPSIGLYGPFSTHVLFVRKPSAQ